MGLLDVNRVRSSQNRLDVSSALRQRAIPAQRPSAQLGRSLPSPVLRAQTSRKQPHWKIWRLVVAAGLPLTAFPRAREITLLTDQTLKCLPLGLNVPGSVDEAPVLVFLWADRQLL
jgi:hypothetical protein